MEWRRPRSWLVPGAAALTAVLVVVLVVLFWDDLALGTLGDWVAGAGAAGAVVWAVWEHRKNESHRSADLERHRRNARRADVAPLLQDAVLAVRKIITHARSLRTAVCAFRNETEDLDPRIVELMEGTLTTRLSGLNEQLETLERLQLQLDLKNETAASVQCALALEAASQTSHGVRWFLNIRKLDGLSPGDPEPLSALEKVIAAQLDRVEEAQQQLTALTRDLTDEW